MERNNTLKEFSNEVFYLYNTITGLRGRASSYVETAWLCPCRNFMYFDISNASSRDFINTFLCSCFSRILQLQISSKPHYTGLNFSSKCMSFSI